MADKPGRGSDQFPLRLPDGMRDHLKTEAEKNGRSMNAEIVTRLEASLAGAVGGGTVDQIFANTLQQLMTRAKAPTAAQLRYLTLKYDQFRQLEVQQLREFLDIVADLWRDQDLLGTYQDQYQRALEHEVTELRSRARMLGFELVENVDAIIHLDDVLSDHKIREQSDKS